MTFDWGVFFHYLWPPTAFQDPLVWQGLIATVVIAILAQILGVILGLIAALSLLSRIAPVRWLMKIYVTYFRGTPMLVQLSLIYFGLSSLGIYKFPELNLGIVSIPGWMQAAILGLGLNEGAFMTEIIRAGIMSIDTGQLEAAKALGMTSRRAFRWVILPQAAVVIVPPLGNEFNGMIKNTSLVVVIGGLDIFNAYEQLNGTLFRPFELFLAVSCYYLALTMIWSGIQSRIEKRLGRSRVRVTVNKQPNFPSRLLTGARNARVSQ